MEPRWVLLLVIALAVLCRVIHLRLTRLPLPPGPPALPVLGNILSMPTAHSFKQFHAWKQQYGPIFRLIAGKDTIIVLGDHATAHELLNKRSSNYSDRPRLPMASELLYKGDHMLLRRFDDKYRAHKRNLGQIFTTRASRAVTPFADMESIASLRQLFDPYCAVVMALHRFTASMSYVLLYGFRVRTGREPEMRDAQAVEENFAHAMRPGAWPCDVLPLLNYLPSWLAPWKRTAEAWYRFERAHHIRSNARGHASRAWNWTKALAGTRAARSLNPESLAFDAGVLNNAALDTTTQTLEMFIMAAISNPEQMRTACAEIDRVVGRGRLPCSDDEKDLPYVRAVIEETLRWRPIIAGGIPHSNIRENVYNGYRIPAGSTVIPNIWSIHMDDSVYHDPELFRPERWLGSPGLPAPASFGYGRRVCMGDQIARGALFVMVSRLLRAFEFGRQVDEAGREIAVDTMDLTDYFIVRPNPFPVSVTCRHEMVRKVVAGAWDQIEKDPEVIMEEMGKHVGRSMR